MSYLEGYGVKEARREKWIKWLLAGLLLALILGVVLYFQLRNYREERQIRAFFEYMQKQDYRSAYALWGCTEATPCPNYQFDKFMEDWGPKSVQANLSAAKIGKVKSCATGIIQFLEFPDKHEVQLWVERRDKTIAFAPWPVCNPRMKVP